MKRRGFTIMELMVAMAILSMLLIAMVQGVGAVSRSWRSGVASAENLAQARSVLGLLERDIQSIVLSPDLAAFVDERGNPACAFYSRVLGGNGERRLSLVHFRVFGEKGLTRADYGLDYGDRVLSLNETAKLPDLVNAQVEEFAEGVVRFRCQYLNGAGELRDVYQFDYANPDKPANTRALVVSLLVLDNTAHALAQRTSSLGTLMAAFPEDTNGSGTLAMQWQKRIDTGALPANLPLPIRSGVRVFERTISIPPSQ